MLIIATAKAGRYSLLDAMGDFTQPETLALVAKCSRAARARVVPLLEMKKADKAEMHRLLQRLFPAGIKDLVPPAELNDASLYNDLLEWYFAPNQRSLPRHCEVVHKIGLLRPKHSFQFGGLINDIIPEMQTAIGRRMLLRAVDEWIEATDRSVKLDWDKRDKKKQLGLLERIKDAVLNDFAVRFHRISTVHQEYDNYP